MRSHRDRESACDGGEEMVDEEEDQERDTDRAPGDDPSATSKTRIGFTLRGEPSLVEPPDRIGDLGERDKDKEDCPRCCYPECRDDASPSALGHERLELHA